MATRDPEAKMTEDPATYRLTGRTLEFWGGSVELPTDVAEAIRVGHPPGELYRIERNPLLYPGTARITWIGGSATVPLEVADEIGAPR